MEQTPGRGPRLPPSGGAVVIVVLELLTGMAANAAGLGAMVTVALIGWKSLAFMKRIVYGR